MLGPRIAAETLRRFWTMLAHHQSGLLNASEFARSLGVDSKTVASYLDLLVDLLLVRRLEPWHHNTGKRLVKSPRLFMVDTGLACHLSGIGTAEQVLASDMLGFLAENLLLQDLYAWRETRTPKPEILYWRTTSGKEVDFVIEAGDALLPVEVKTSRRARLEDTHSLRAFLDDYPGQARHGILVYAGERVERLTGKIWAVPFSLALGL
jgi:predicted AAA+ superfamily ATPase